MNDFIPEIWAQEVLADFPAATVGYSLCTTQYEGEIKGKGSKVNIVAAQEMTVQPYVAGQDIVPEALSSSKLQLEITEADAIAGEIDRTIQAVSPYNLQGIYQNEGSLALAKSSDLKIMKAMAAGAHPDNTLEVDLTSSNIFQTLEECSTRLADMEVPENARQFIVMTPRDIQKIRRSDDYITADKLDPETLITGQHGRYYNLDILRSRNVFTPAAADVPNGQPIYRQLPFGMVGATAFANAIPADSVSAEPMEKRFALLIKGLHMYGVKVIRPKAMGLLKVNTGETGTQV